MPAVDNFFGTALAERYAVPSVMRWGKLGSDDPKRSVKLGTNANVLDPGWNR